LFFNPLTFVVSILGSQIPICHGKIRWDDRTRL